MRLKGKQSSNDEIKVDSKIKVSCLVWKRALSGLEKILKHNQRGGRVAQNFWKLGGDS